MFRRGPWQRGEGVGCRTDSGVSTGRSYSPLPYNPPVELAGYFHWSLRGPEGRGPRVHERSGKPREGMRVYRDVERRALRPDRQSATIVGNQRDMTLFRLLAIPLTTEQVPFPGSTS